MTDYAISALVKRLAELTGDLDRLQVLADRLVEDIGHLTAAIQLIDPEYPVEKVRPREFRPVSHGAARGEMTRLILGMLREAGEPMTSRDLAQRLIAKRELDPQDKRLHATIEKRIKMALLRMERSGTVTRSACSDGRAFTVQLSAER